VGSDVPQGRLPLTSDAWESGAHFSAGVGQAYDPRARRGWLMVQSAELQASA
jgi:hypothetical protein